MRPIELSIESIPDREFLKRGEAAAFLRGSISKLDRLSAAGQLPRYVVGGTVLYRLEDLRALVAAGREDGPVGVVLG